jgi:hypothetical protein
VLRRIQDYSDIKGANLSIAFLDWEKAFDKIQHDKLIIALHRLGFNSHYTDVIADCYRTPQFFVKDFLDVLTGRFNPLGFAKAAHYHLFYLFLS